MAGAIFNKSYAFPRHNGRRRLKPARSKLEAEHG